MNVPFKHFVWVAVDWVVIEGAVQGIICLITDTVLSELLATAKSGLPSPSMSHILTERGFAPVAKSTFAAKLTVPGVEVLLKTDTVLGTEIAATKSGLPSPFISPKLTEKAPMPVVKSTLVAKLTVPEVEVLRNTDTVLLLL